ncbi:isopeptide-forming domain-containing fimbrial protein [Streptococcus oralis]|uniref:isopeptide-forming domain-containing fimbrial protein n=1 Tax=Streptococcus oralis TaxID=1303 RepID=UPI0023312E9B|nr:isopeptide-forming domain-containing fimbrial protein [Streptococcus oralis]MDB6208765.1 isopeptide-forming domain-containing fimbrial protein [Streptococcus oralis]
MKKLKFILAAIVTLLVTFVGGKAYAYTITINGETDGHTFEAYQIFKGDLNDSTLSNIQWGTGVNQFTFNGSDNAAKIAEGLTESNAVEFSKEAAKHLKQPTASGSSSIEVSEAGYYLIKDKDNSLTGKDGKAYTAYILKVIKDETVKPKADVPSVIKKVKDTNDTTGETTDWQDSADYDFGDKVPFQLTATLPKTNFDKYQTYYLEFSDTLSKGLEFNADSLTVKVGESVLTAGQYKITTEKDTATGATKLSVVITDVKALGGTAGGKVTVDYTATLTTDAVIGAKGNPNEVELIYSNNPNENGTGKPKDTGKTPKDTVIVFTYKTVVNKVDQNNQPLTGAEFTLFKKMKDGTEKAVSVVKNDAGTQFTFKGLDDGEYVLKETVTPAGYNTIKPITFKVVATHDVESDAPKLTDLNGEKVSGNINFSKNVDEGSLTTQVENKKGSILPSTGSIGTTVLYVAGSVLVVAAGILLVTKKRMKN